MFKSWRKFEMKRWSSIQQSIENEKLTKLFKERFLEKKNFTNLPIK